MKATGIVRRIDDLGRVVIPKEIRRTLHIRVGEPLEIYVSGDGEVIFRKYSPLAVSYTHLQRRHGGSDLRVQNSVFFHKVCSILKNLICGAQTVCRSIYSWSKTHSKSGLPYSRWSMSMLAADSPMV